MRISMPLLTRVGLAMALGLAGLFLFRVVFAPDNDHLTSMVVRWGSVPQVLDYKAIAPYDFVAFSPGAWNGPKAAARADSLRKGDLDKHVGQYLSVMTMGAWYIRGTDQLSKDYVAAVSQYLAHTTTGDTAALFLANPAINVTLPPARTAIIKLFIDNLGVADWAFCDFFSIPMPDLKVHQPLAYQIQEEGDMDLDEDGVGHWDDEDERELLRASFFSFVRELRAALPTDRIPGKFLLFANGQLALQDSTFADLFDGVFLEGFPRYNRGFTRMLDPTNPYGLAALCRRMDYVALDGNHGLLATMWDNAVEAHIWPDKSLFMPVDQSRDLAYLGKALAPAWHDSLGWHREFKDHIVTIDNRAVASVARKEK